MSLSWNSPLDGLDVLTSTKIPLFSALQTSTNGFTPSVPRYGFTVRKSVLNAEQMLFPTFTLPRCAVAYAAEVEPISPRFASPITTRPFSWQYFTVLSYTFNPSMPNCSYMAICGFTDGIRSQVWSTISLLKFQMASAAPSNVSPNSPKDFFKMCSGI